MLRKLVYLFILTISLIGCKTEIPKTDPIFDDSIKLTKRLKLAIDANLLGNSGIPKEVSASVYAFYKNRGFKPFWSNDTLMEKRGEAWTKLLENPTALGLPENRFVEVKDDSLKRELIVQELMLTSKLSQLIADLKVGFMDSTKMDFRPAQAASLEQLILRTNQFDTVTHWGTWFASFGPSIPDYQLLAIALFNQASSKTLSKIHFEIPEMEDDSVSCFNLARESLIDKGYLNGKDTSIDGFWEAMATFQSDNGLKADGIIGTYSRQALDESPFYKYQRAILSLERWRWREPFPERYIWVNIPEYMLRIYYNDTLFSMHRVVVGKPENQTPQLQSRLRTIVALPYWTQPHSIASKEFLPAMQRNPNYASKNHYKVFRGNEEVDPLTINWKKYKEKNFPFKVRQEPGEDNALGLVKFEFSNKFSVYIHDTPSKGFFRKDVRAYSHGCVRCEMPDSLARFILTRDDLKNQKITRDSLDSIVARREHYPIALRKPIPVQIDYITVVADSSGRMIFYTDIYERDKKYLEALKIFKKEK